MALGVGALVGAGVRARCRGRLAGAVTAALIAAVAAGVTRFATFAYVLDGPREELAVASMAQFIVKEYEQAGLAVEMPPTGAVTRVRDLFPQQIWKEALAHWRAMDRQRKAQVRRQIIAAPPRPVALVVQAFGSLDALWIAPAILIAAALGARRRETEPNAGAAACTTPETKTTAGAEFWPPHLRQPVGAMASGDPHAGRGSATTRAGGRPRSPAGAADVGAADGEGEASRTAVAGMRLPAPAQAGVKGRDPSGPGVPGGR
jgi:hypothetical protein